MTILSIYSPPSLNILGPGYPSAVTQWVGNPFATEEHPASDVWIQCTPAWIVGYGLSDGATSVSGIGILEIEYLDAGGHIQQQAFGDVNDPTGNASLAGLASMPTRYYQSGFLSATILLLSENSAAYGTTTFFLWG